MNAIVVAEESEDLKGVKPGTVLSIVSCLLTSSFTRDVVLVHLLRHRVLPSELWKMSLGQPSFSSVKNVTLASEQVNDYAACLLWQLRYWVGGPQGSHGAALRQLPEAGASFPGSKPLLLHRGKIRACPSCQRPVPQPKFTRVNLTFCFD